MPAKARNVARFRHKEFGVYCGGILGYPQPDGSVKNVMICVPITREEREDFESIINPYGSGPVPIVPKRAV